MSVVRRFLLVSSLGRLIRKERGGSRITEGYFAPQGGRTSLVRIDGQQCHLVLIAGGSNGAATEERTEVPRAHGDALMDVCAGKAVYERATLTVSPGRDALIDRYVQPAGVDLVSVSFESEDEAKGFRPPVWFGNEVTSDKAYDRHAIALSPAPEPPRLSLTSAMLDALLDTLEPRYGIGRFSGSSTGASPQRTSPVGPSASGTSPMVSPVREPSEDVIAPAERAAAEPDSSSSAGPPSVMPQASPPTVPPARSAPTSEKSEEGKPDARIDDVIESLSQALGAAIQQPADGTRRDELSGSFERWQVRPRRTQQ